MTLEISASVSKPGTYPSHTVKFQLDFIFADRLQACPGNIMETSLVDVFS
jgi:hypothetical protein